MEITQRNLEKLRGRTVTYMLRSDIDSQGIISEPKQVTDRIVEVSFHHVEFESGNIININSFKEIS